MRAARRGVIVRVCYPALAFSTLGSGAVLVSQRFLPSPIVDRFHDRTSADASVV